MPRNYVPKLKTYTELKLQEALEKLQKGEISYREAEDKYKIDKSLLWRRVHNYNTSKQGRKTVLSMEEEKDLADKIKIMAKWGWALTRREIKEVVRIYLLQNNKKKNFKNYHPGNDWMQLFLKRNGLVSKKMEQLEKSRRQATSDPFIIYHFYEILEDTLTALDLHDKPQHIFNLDETSFSSDPTRIKGVAGKGQKAHRIIQGSGKENTTVLGCVSARGRLLPPLIIFKGQNLWSSWKGTNDIPGTTYACSENGWMLTSIYNEWFENFCKTVTQRPLLVIFDGHITHLDPATIQLAVRENVTLLKLPAHTTDVLQPMDASCFGPIKYKWNELLIEWQRLNQRPLTKSEFCDLLGEVWRHSLSQRVVQNSFKVTGLYPVNKDAYPKDRLDPVKLERYIKYKLSSDTIPRPLYIFENSPVDEHDGCVSPSIMATDCVPPLVIGTQTTEDRQNLQRESTSGTAISSGLCPIPSDPNKNPEPSCSFETLLLSKIKQTKPTTGKRRKIDGRGKLLTSEEYLKSIENLDCKQKRKQRGKLKNKKQKQKTTLKNSDTDTDIGEEEIPYADESDLDNISLSALIENELDKEVDELHNDDALNKICDAESQNVEHATIAVESTENLTNKSLEHGLVKQMDEYGIGDFVLVVHTLKNNKNYYVARIEGSDDNNHLSVIYLKHKKNFLYVYPDTNIIYSIERDEIVMKLPSPKQKSKRDALMFDIDLEKYNIK